MLTIMRRTGEALYIGADRLTVTSVNAVHRSCILTIETPKTILLNGNTYEPDEHGRIVLAIATSEFFWLGMDIYVAVKLKAKHAIRLDIEAPDEVAITRKELLDSMLVKSLREEDAHAPGH